MHSVELARRQAAAEQTLQERVTDLVAARGGAFAFDPAPARGDANLRRLFLLEAVNAALAGLAQEAPAQSEVAPPTKKAAKKDA